MSEKPSKVEVGQRWQRDDGFAYTVVEKNAKFYLRTNGGKDFPWHPEYRDSLTYLGGPEPVKPPTPAKGQRWADTWNKLEYTLDEHVPAASMPGKMRWTLVGTMAGLLDEYFENGRMAFVDHGEPASPPSQPRTGPRTDSGPAEPVNGDVLDDGGNPRVGSKKGAESSPRNHEATSGEHARAGYGTPAPFTARAILQAKERARQAKRDEDARAVAAFCDEWDLLPDV